MAPTVILYILLFASCCFAQTIKTPFPEKLTHTAGNVTKGFMDALDWYDVPMAAAFYLRKDFENSALANNISFAPTPFDRLVNERLSTNSSSLGSMDKDVIPGVVFYSRLAMNVGLELLTNERVTSKAYRDIFLFRKTLLYTYTITEYVKAMVDRDRPNGADNRSFCSGHTSTTFAAATFLYRELDDFYDEWTVTRNDDTMRALFKTTSFAMLYGWAGYVGYSRVKDSKHYVSDVVVGAALGTLVSYFVYSLYNDADGSFLSGMGVSATPNSYLGISYNMKF